MPGEWKFRKWLRIPQLPQGWKMKNLVDNKKKRGKNLAFEFSKSFENNKSFHEYWNGPELHTKFQKKLTRRRPHLENIQCIDV